MRVLQDLYLRKRLSVIQISRMLGCSQGQVNYWLARYHIKKRSISEAIYCKHNPEGDPFTKEEPRDMKQAVLYGLGIGLYWGEGTKKSKNSVRLGNTDPFLIKRFLDFLISFYQIDTRKLRFGLQVFNDVSMTAARSFWKRFLGIKSWQMQKVVISRIRGPGSYRNKSKYGVLTIYFNNKKLRDELCSQIEKLRAM